MKSRNNFLKNRFLLNRDYCMGKAFLKAYPVEITVELTNKCNLNCIFCPHSKMRRAQGFMDFSLFKNIIDEVAGFAECIDLDLMGESTMHPNIIEMIQYCKKAGLKVTLNSNMVKVDQKLGKSLIDSGLDMLVMSIDSVHKETYEKLRRGASFDETKHNVHTLLSLDSKDLYRVVQMVYITHNKAEAGQFIRHWRNSNANFVRIQPYQNVDKQNLQLNALPARRRSKRRPCIHPWKKIAVCWDGTAVICCNDYDKFKVVGDVKKESVLDIWNGQGMQGIRRNFVAGDFRELSLCRDCFSFNSGNMMLWGSTFVDPINIRKLLFVFERVMVFNHICFFRYF